MEQDKDLIATQDTVTDAMEAVNQATRRMREENIFLREQLANLQADLIDTKAILDKYGPVLEVARGFEEGKDTRFVIGITDREIVSLIAVIADWYEKHLKDPRILKDASWNGKATVVVKDMVWYVATMARGAFTAAAKSGEFISRRRA